VRSRRRLGKQRRTELKKNAERRKGGKADHRSSHSSGRHHQHLHESAAEKEEHC
jgi:hypothetical protein